MPVRVPTISSACCLFTQNSSLKHDLSVKVEFARHIQKLLGGGAAAPLLVNILQGIF